MSLTQTPSAVTTSATSKNSVAWQQDVAVDPNQVILTSILEHLEPATRTQLQEEFGPELADVFDHALSQRGQSVRMLLQAGVPTPLMYEMLRAVSFGIHDQATLDALLDHGLDMQVLIDDDTPSYMLVASANRDERLFDALVQKRRFRIHDLLLMRAEPKKLARHLTRFRPETVRLLLQYGIELSVLEAYIDQCDAVNQARGSAAHYFRRQVQSILDEARVNG